MHIQVNTDSNIEGHETLAAQVSGTVESALSRFNDHITRVEACPVPLFAFAGGIGAARRFARYKGAEVRP